MATPNLGYGKQSEVAIDTVNQWMRQEPWYQNQMRAWGQDPGHPTLTKAQSTTIKRLAQAQGVVVDEGQMEIDDHGNFNPIGHKLRNTLIVAGVAAAALATAGAAGAFSGAALGPATAGNMAATSAIAGGSAVPASLAAGSSAAAVGGGMAGLGLSYGDLLRYGIPEGLSAVNAYYNRKDANAARADQDKYLQMALEYQKEQDAFNRARQQTLDDQERSRYAYMSGRDAAQYGDSQQEYLAGFERDEDRYAYSTDREAARYGDYSKRIAPYLASGANANVRMSNLLGLPAAAPFDPTLTPGPTRVRSAPPRLSDPGTGYGGGPSPQQRGPLDAATQKAIRDALRAANSSDDPAAWDEYVSSHGDSSTKNWPYWLNRINTGDGVGKGYRG